MVTREPREGGASERSLASKYAEESKRIRDTSLKLARAFLDVSAHYDAAAKEEDTFALRERLGR